MPFLRLKLLSRWRRQRERAPAELTGALVERVKVFANKLLNFTATEWYN